MPWRTVTFERSRGVADPFAFGLVAEVISAHSCVRKKPVSALTKERGGVFSSRHWRFAGWTSPAAVAVGADSPYPKTPIHLGEL